MYSVDRLLKTIRGVSKTNPVTHLQLSEIIRRLWSDQGKIINIINNEIINNTTVIYQSISQIIGTKQADNHFVELIENTANISETVVSPWSVLPYNQQMGEFKTVVAVRNKTTDIIETLISLLSFDYSDVTPAIVQNDLLTNATMTLTVGVDGSNMLYATVSGMNEDNKRIHFCLERCVLSERAMLMEAYGELNLTASAELTAFILASATGNFNLSGSASLTNEAPLAPIGYGRLYPWWMTQGTGDNSITSNDDWDVPTIYQFRSLITSIGGNSFGGKLKQIGTDRWNDPNVGATNETELQFVGGGLRFSGDFYYLKDYCYVWSKTQYNSSTAYGIQLNNLDGNVAEFSGDGFKDCGMSIRLCKTSTSLAEGNHGTYIQNDGIVLQTVVRNGIEWLAEHLKETKIRSGADIPNVIDSSAWNALTSADKAMCVYGNNPDNI